MIRGRGGEKGKSKKKSALAAFLALCALKPKEGSVCKHTPKVSWLIFKTRSVNQQFRVAYD